MSIGLMSSQTRKNPTNRKEQQADGHHCRGAAEETLEIARLPRGGDVGRTRLEGMTGLGLLIGQFKSLETEALALRGVQSEFGGGLPLESRKSCIIRRMKRSARSSALSKRRSSSSSTADFGSCVLRPCALRAGVFRGETVDLRLQRGALVGAGSALRLSRVELAERHLAGTRI